MDEQDWAAQLAEQRHQDKAATYVATDTRAAQLNEQLQFAKTQLQRALDTRDPAKAEQYLSQLLQLRSEQTKNTLVQTKESLGALPQSVIDAQMNGLAKEVGSLIAAVRVLLAQQ